MINWFFWRWSTFSFGFACFCFNFDECCLSFPDGVSYLLELQCADFWGGGLLLWKGGSQSHVKVIGVSNGELSETPNPSSPPLARAADYTSRPCSTSLRGHHAVPSRLETSNAVLCAGRKSGQKRVFDATRPPFGENQISKRTTLCRNREMYPSACLTRQKSVD